MLYRKRCGKQARVVKKKVTFYTLFYLHAAEGKSHFRRSSCTCLKLLCRRSPGSTSHSPRDNRSSSLGGESTVRGTPPGCYRDGRAVRDRWGAEGKG